MSVDGFIALQLLSAKTTLEPDAGTVSSPVVSCDALANSAVSSPAGGRLRRALGFIHELDLDVHLNCVDGEL